MPEKPSNSIRFQNKKAESLYAAAKYSALTGNFEAARQQIKKASNLSPSESLRLKLADLKREIKAQQNFR